MTKYHLAAFLSCFSIVAGSAADAPPIQVMVLGTYHFDNPGRDLHNVKAESVLTPSKQAELEQLAERLAKFQPNKIAIEAQADLPGYGSRKFSSLTSEALKTNADERVQIAFRLAQKLALPGLQAIDEQSETKDYFPWEKVERFAKANGRQDLLDDLNKRVEAMTKATEAAQKTTPLALQLAAINDPARIRSEHADFYYALLALGNETEQPGAELNAGWYERNAKIFAKLTQIARPGDRILVVFGGGHSYWLRHFVEHTPGFELVEPAKFLQ